MNADTKSLRKSQHRNLPKPRVRVKEREKERDTKNRPRVKAKEKARVKGRVTTMFLPSSLNLRMPCNVKCCLRPFS